MTESVYALKPQFSNREGYLAWRNTWKLVYRHIGDDIRRRKTALREAQRRGENTAKMQRNLVWQRADARKLMTLLEEARLLRDRIKAMKKQMEEQHALFPIVLETNRCDVHYNKIHNTFSWMPMWVVKAQGRSYYCDHIDAQMGFSTRELDSGSTRGMLRFRHCRVSINGENVATLEKTMG